MPVRNRMNWAPDPDYGQSSGILRQNAHNTMVTLVDQILSSSENLDLIRLTLHNVELCLMLITILLFVTFGISVLYFLCRRFGVNSQNSRAASRNRTFHPYNDKMAAATTMMTTRTNPAGGFIDQPTVVRHPHPHSSESRSQYSQMIPSIRIDATATDRYNDETELVSKDRESVDSGTRVEPAITKKVPSPTESREDVTC